MPHRERQRRTEYHGGGEVQREERAQGRFFLAGGKLCVTRDRGWTYVRQEKDYKYVCVWICKYRALFSLFLLAPRAAWYEKKKTRIHHKNTLNSSTCPHYPAQTNLSFHLLDLQQALARNASPVSCLPPLLSSRLVFWLCVELDEGAGSANRFDRARESSRAPKAAEVCVPLAAAWYRLPRCLSPGYLPPTQVGSAVQRI